MGMTSEMIGRSINPEFPGVYARTTRLVQLEFIDHSKMIGFFVETKSSKSLQIENKYSFIESKNAIQYRDSENEKLVTVVDGNELIGVSFPNEPIPGTNV